MKRLCLGLLLVVLHNEVTRSFAYLPKKSNYDRRNPVYDSERKLIEILKSAKRTNWSMELCGRFDDWCKPGSENPVLICCSGYKCKCSLWNSTCKCRTSLFGR